MSNYDGYILAPEPDTDRFQAAVVGLDPEGKHLGLVRRAENVVATQSYLANDFALVRSANIPVFKPSWPTPILLIHDF